MLQELPRQVHARTTLNQTNEVLELYLSGKFTRYVETSIAPCASHKKGARFKIILHQPGPGGAFSRQSANLVAGFLLNGRRDKCKSLIALCNECVKVTRHMDKEEHFGKGCPATN
jgi:hypothetical protein